MKPAGQQAAGILADRPQLPCRQPESDAGAKTLVQGAQHQACGSGHRSNSPPLVYRRGERGYLWLRDGTGVMAALVPVRAGVAAGQFCGRGCKYAHRDPGGEGEGPPQGRMPG